MSARKKYLASGIVLIASFIAVLVAIFMPLLDGHNSLEFLDNLYNSISKGSAYYVPDCQEKVAALGDASISAEVGMKDADQAAQTAAMLTSLGVTATASAEKLSLEGPVAKPFDAVLADADLMYKNDGDALKQKYNIEAKQAMYNWWSLMSALSKTLLKQDNIREGNVADSIVKRAIEPAYNFYGIQAEKISTKWMLLAASLAFYVLYTVWYGFGLLFLFEGVGFQLDH